MEMTKGLWNKGKRQPAGCFHYPCVSHADFYPETGQMQRSWHAHTGGVLLPGTPAG